jgi:hypothetical protein
MISQINSIPEPIHPNYKQFMKRLVSFLETEQQIMLLVTRVASNEKFIQLLSIEGFNNSTNDEIMNIVQDNVLETFADNTVEHMTNNVRRKKAEKSTSSDYSVESYYEKMSSYRDDPSMSIFIYAILAVCVYIVYKHYANKK